MTEQHFPSISAHKYNNWCERRVLVCVDQNRYRTAVTFVARRDLAQSERAAFYLHELTGCEGLEFVAFSNARLKKAVTLANDVILVPCFLSEMKGQNVHNPLVQQTKKMERKCRFIYDGWVPIATWDEEDVRKAVRSVDEAFSIFCLSTRAYFEWEPKYPASGESRSIYKYEDQHIQDLEGVAKLLDSLCEGDRVALYRSLGWLSQGLRINEPAARFLFSILAIESLATYIEKDTPDDSPLAVLRAECLTRTERLERRKKCIDDILSERYKSDPTDAINKAYFDCVIGIKRRLETHLRNVFTSDPEPIALLFEQKVEEKSLYDLRHVVAHGTADVLSEVQRDQISRRVWDAEQIARRYILSVLQKALGMQPFSNGITAAMPLEIQNAVVSSECMYRGPTHMADVYS